jgi:hypothetical protein
VSWAGFRFFWTKKKMNSNQSKEMNCDMMHAHQTRDHLERRFEFENFIRAQAESSASRVRLLPPVANRVKEKPCVVLDGVVEKPARLIGKLTIPSCQTPYVSAMEGNLISRLEKLNRAVTFFYEDTNPFLALDAVCDRSLRRVFSVFDLQPGDVKQCLK